MLEVYDQYETDIDGFLAAHSLTPTVKYNFNGANVNQGSTGDSLPAITFQSPEVYNDVSAFSTVTDNLPHIEVKSVSNEAWTSQLALDGTVFSAFSNVTEVYAVAFAEAVNLEGKTGAEYIAFLEGNGVSALTDVTSAKYEVKSFVHRFSTAFTGFETSGAATAALDTSVFYNIRVVAKDAAGNVGVNEFIPSFPIRTQNIIEMDPTKRSHIYEFQSNYNYMKMLTDDYAVIANTTGSFEILTLTSPKTRLFYLSLIHI